MNDGNPSPGKPGPLRLSPQQQDVVQALRSRENERYPLSEWYLGALYAVSNHHNPDSIPQAAHSLRELMEKLPRVVLESDWYERRGRPSRREQGQIVIEEIDPLSDQLNARIQEAKGDRLYQLRQQLEKFAHHGDDPEIKDFESCLGMLERAVLDLFAPITAKDQQEIRSILNRDDRSGTDIRRIFELLERRGANYAYFFDNATDASWIPFLRDKGYFSDPPNVEPLGDGQVNSPYWWPLHYLANVVRQAPDDVIEVILRLPKVDNPRVTLRILDIARQLPGTQSVKLKSKVLDEASVEQWFSGHWYADLLAHWVRENETTAALELTEMLVQFEPDPQLEAKRNWQLENQLDWSPPITPTPRLREWDYKEMIERGVHPLAEKEPQATARILVNATEDMIRLEMQEESQNDEGDEDYSEVWCRRLNQYDDGDEQSSNVLIRALTFACEQVYRKGPDSIAALDESLRSKQWKIFKRLRQHLSALHPTEQTKPWIRDVILEATDYSLWPHHYEFQQMVRSACEHFGEKLLTKNERERIFDSILSGPPKERYVASWGEGFTEELFERRRQYFHRMQFKPFAAVLFGKYADYFHQLEDESVQQISDENYLLIGDIKTGTVLPQSPRSPEDLAVFSDDELMDYINQWDEGHGFEPGGDGGEWLVEVNIEALAEAFKSLFRASILPNADRFRFWVEHCDKIERTIYVRAMINGIEENVKERNFEHLEESLTLCEWVLSHPDQDPAAGFSYSDQSRDLPHWHGSRRAVEDLVRSCVQEDTDVPISFQEQLAKLLDMLCTQFDWLLDRNEPVFLNRNDQFGEAINITRSRALESLVRCGLWLRRKDQEADISFLVNILEKRFGSDAEYPLTLPEYAILGVYYGSILSLDSTWAAGHTSDFFPQHALNRWRAAFGPFLQFTNPHSQIFEALRSQFEFALENLPNIEEDGNPRTSLTDKLGEHLFEYYLRGVYPLKGEKSLLYRFFQKTWDQPERWSTLFRHVGFVLKNTKDLNQNYADRVKTFFEWRLAQENAEELGRFWFWLGAECLDAEWRLDAFSKTIDIGRPKDIEIYGEVGLLDDHLPSHPAKVVECFAKLTDKLEDYASNVPA